MKMNHSSCGVGFLVSLDKTYSFENLNKGLLGLKNVEHRGGVGQDGLLGDGAGIMTNIPFKLLGYDEFKVAVATIFAPMDSERYKNSIEVFKSTFEFSGLNILEIRDVPVNPSALSPLAQDNMPKIIQVVIKRPEHCRTLESFDKLLYFAKQNVRTKQKEQGITGEFFFTSLSSRSIVYKALATSSQLEEFYPDLKNPEFKTNFVVFHRRFSTNTKSSWDKVQPFRLIAHNGEINTIEGNRAAAISREKAIGLQMDELITRYGSSDSGNFNGMVEALKYRSSIPNLSEILSIMLPPASTEDSEYFKFWSRAMEPWDGPALIAFSDGKRIGARLDRNGFRPCRWTKTKDTFYLASEAGCFELPPISIIKQGCLHAGRSVNIHVLSGEVSFNNPDKTKFYERANFDSRLIPLDFISPEEKNSLHLDKKSLFYFTKEDLNKELYPMIIHGKEAIGSMGDTARLPALSNIHRSIYDYFYQNFAQVTNPPLDYIREKMVTELKVYLGRKPNIFSPKELIPPPQAIELASPIISLGQMEYIHKLHETQINVKVKKFDILFKRGSTPEEFNKAIQEVVKNVILEVKCGLNVIVLSDRNSTYNNLPIPSILVMRAVQLQLNHLGIRLRVSLIVDTAEIRNSHQIAVLIGFGASAVCPYLALEIARNEEIPNMEDTLPDEKEQRLIGAFNQGLLRIMAKRGISVLRSYQGAELFTIIGLNDDIIELFFAKHKSIIGGLNFQNLVDEIHARTEETKDGEIPNNFLYKEQASEKKGERHSISSKRSRVLHQILKEDSSSVEGKVLFKNFAEEFSEPCHIRNLLDYKKNKIDLSKVTDQENILKTFGCGAMSFGAISAEAQRDLIIAFKAINGRSNSGEGGENPYYFTDGISASVKQIASGRFGVDAEYLVTGSEVQIKIAQGAKPGEGGQLMGIKVNADIARARHSNIGVNLISPPPQHDIYSIEDLKQLIYEIKQLNSKLSVSVKLVAGHNIGNIAVGVVKAGADIIQISGGDGGTGAASLMSMKHAGLPWEVGLNEVHRNLAQNNLRSSVILRVDGGLQNGRDIIMGAILGADEFDFGKMVLIAEGCIMARVCEKNTCPAGIATHDPKFKKRYKGNPQAVINYLKYLADDVRDHLANIGFPTLKELIGRTDLLETNPKHHNILKRYNLRLDHFLKKAIKVDSQLTHGPDSENILNDKVLSDYLNNNLKNHYDIKSTDKAVPASLTGNLALEVNKSRLSSLDKSIRPDLKKAINLTFIGSAGQGFAIFNTQEMNVKLEGEANDSVAKGMSGGIVTIIPHKNSSLDSNTNVLIGNTALYGATGGVFHLNGLSGDRFAIRNSGTLAITKGVGLHACEYMTGGTVIILGPALENIGAGMTGGVLYITKEGITHINSEFIKEVEIQEANISELSKYLVDYYNDIDEVKNSQEIKNIIKGLHKFVPID
ncbi:MAG: glutamate synthase domain-containing protein 2/glutamate synthase domain-containing protein 1 [Bacteriovoracaceae bacterium]|jgi:glutamate synthase domain-containing protein 2/glutamate synthase domain-containing protein 1/glutamate synthase domain-containing protein 3